MKDRSFGVLQRIGRSFMLPIALLPVAGLFLGIGSSFTNPTTLNAYGLTGLIHEGNFLYTVLDILSRAGNAVFANLPLLFAIGVSIGMAKREKEVAGLSSVIAYLIMNTVISALIAAKGGVETMAPNTTESNLGITTLSMGVFGGIIVGLGVAWLHNKFYNIELPKVLSFFGGTRFVPIISSIVYLFVGALMFYVWPVVQSGIAWLGNLVLASGYAGTWIYGIIERALIPFGLHHVFYVPFWQTSIGGTAVIDGMVINGAQNIFFAELASKATETFSVSATRFMSGKFPFMIFGLPGAALALYKTALPEKRKLVGSLLVSAALTSVLTGITEPLEFTFLFAAPLLYAVHCILAGLSYMLMHIFGVGVGMTFSGGLIDLFLFGVLQGNAKTNWIWIPVVGIVYFFVYYFLFKFMIKKFNYRTPGRFADEEETKLYTRKDLQKGKSDFTQSKLILEGLGGKNNITDIDCCATRLRVTLKNPELANEVKLKESGASGVIKKGDGIQVIYGPIVSNVKSSLENYMDTVIEEEEVPCEKGKCEIIYSPLNGKIVPLDKVPDSAFSSLAMGNGVAIEPNGGVLVAPCDGTVKSVFPTGHAVAFVTDSGAEILIHIGIDTVKLKGRHFEKFVVNNQHVKKGQKLISFDIEQIKKEGYKTIVPIVICNTPDYKSIVTLKTGSVGINEKLLKLE